MSRAVQDIREFDRELTQLVRHHFEGLFGAHQVNVVHDAFVKILERFVAAHAAIEEKHGDLSTELGGMLAPIKIAANGGYIQKFEHGAVYWLPGAGAFAVYGEIYAKYVALGAELGILGFPVSDQRVALDGIGRYNNFEGGSIHWLQVSTSPRASVDARCQQQRCGRPRSEARSIICSRLSRCRRSRASRGGPQRAFCESTRIAGM